MSDQLIAEIAFLKERVSTLEKATFGAPSEYVEGWTGAARIVGVNERTCKRRHEANTFPVPCRFDTLVRADGKDHERPTWRRVDLIAYAEGR